MYSGRGLKIKAPRTFKFPETDDELSFNGRDFLFSLLTIHYPPKGSFRLIKYSGLPNKTCP
jgi:hypothetical protein